MLRVCALALALLLPLFLRPQATSGQSELLSINPQLAAGALMFEVDRPGLVEISAASLGVADLTTVRLWRRGVELAPQQDPDALRFVAEPNEGRHSARAVYWLTQDEQPGRRAPLPAIIARPLEWERDSLYQSRIASSRGDRWFAGELRSGTPLTVTLALPRPAPAGTLLEMDVVSSGPGEYRLGVSGGGVVLGEAGWSGDPAGGPRTVALELRSALPAGPVQFDLWLLPPAAPDGLVLLDRLRMPGVPVALPQLPPPQLHPATPHDLRLGPAPGQAGADFVVITHAAFQTALDPLVDAHHRLGDTVGLVEVQQIYNTWSFGERDPEAIRQFLRVAAARWQPAPRSVLLVGGGTVRLRSTDAPDTTFIPPYLVEADPKYGEVACDTCYGRLQTRDVLQQPVPDLAVGRFPVRTLAEAHTLVAKTVTALAGPPVGPWRGRVLALADNDREADGAPDPAGSFTATADGALADAFGMRVDRFYFAPDRLAAGPYDGDVERLRGRFLQAFDEGAALLLYVGHASAWQWAFTAPNATTPHLLNLYDADALGNGARRPILLSMACLSGNWANPTLATVDERLLLHPGGGTAASLSPAGSGVNSGHARLLDGLLPPLLANRATLGQAHLAGIARLVAAGGDQDLAFTFGILGDPNVRLPARTPATFLPLAFR